MDGLSPAGMATGAIALGAPKTTEVMFFIRNTDAPVAAAAQPIRIKAIM